MKADQLQHMTVKELRSLAAQLGVAKASRLLKDELIAALSPKPAGGKKASEASPRAAKPAARPAPRRTRKRTSFTAPSGASSSSAVASSAPPQAAPAKPAVAATAPAGLAIPDQYGRDRLVLLVQDPHHIFAYWELRPETVGRAQAQAGGTGTPVLVLRTGATAEYREVDLRGGNYYLAVAPSGSYAAELALRDSNGHLHALAASNTVATPAPSVSTRIDEQWLGVDETFDELLELAGLPGQTRTFSSINAARLAERRLATWTWQESSTVPGPDTSWSSHSLSSHSLSSASLIRSGKS